MLFQCGLWLFHVRLKLKDLKNWTSGMSSAGLFEIFFFLFFANAHKVIVFILSRSTLIISVTISVHAVFLSIKFTTS